MNTSLSVSTSSVASMWMPSPPAARTSMRILSWAPATECASALSTAAQSRPWSVRSCSRSRPRRWAPGPLPLVSQRPPGLDAKTLAKEAAKQTRATKALAKKVVARIGPLVVSLEAAFTRTDLLAHVPTFAVAPAQASLETLRNYYGAAKDAHTSENPRPLHFESQVVEEAAKAGTTNYQLLSQMMNTAEKHIKG